MHVGPSVPYLAHDKCSVGDTGAPTGPQRSWLLRQMELDTTFLRELNVLDYSLLMAFQRLHEDEKGLGSSLVFRTARWAPERGNSKNEVEGLWESQVVSLDMPCS